MRKYFKVLKAIFRFWLIRFFEFRSQTITWTTLSLVWGFVGLFATNLIFGQVNTIAGWTRLEVLALMACQSFFNAIIWLFINPSLLQVNEEIRDGKLDFLLIKPVSSRFMVTFRKVSYNSVLRTFVMAYIMFYFLSQNQSYQTPFSLFGFLVSFISGLTIYYCLYFMIATLGIWFTKIDNLYDIYDSLVVIGRYPTYVFKNSLRFIFFYLIPIAFVATIPVQFLLGRGEASLIFLSVILAILFYIVSDKFWRFALRHYSSASS